MTTKTIETPVGDLPSPENWINSEYFIPNEKDDQPVSFLEKALDGRTTLDAIKSDLNEYKRLYKAGIASPAEMLTLKRVYPNKPEYQKALDKMGITDNDSYVIGGPASVELVDREGHLITTAALAKAFKKYMANFRTRNAMVLHSDVQVGWALPCYVSKNGQIFKSGVDDKGLFFITELRNDTKISKKVREQIDGGKMQSYSIAGSATKTQTIQKGLMEYMQVDEMELAEVTVCEKGVNQGASFDILKANNSATKSCIDGSCLIEKEETPCMKKHCECDETLQKAKACNHPDSRNCDKDGDQYRRYAKELKTDSSVIKGCNCGKKNGTAYKYQYKSDGDVDFMKSFLSFIKKEPFEVLGDSEGRQENHKKILEQLAFPKEVDQEDAKLANENITDKDIIEAIKDIKTVSDVAQEEGGKEGVDWTSEISLEDLKDDIVNVIKQEFIKKEVPENAVYSASTAPPEGAKEFTTSRGAKYWVPGETKDDEDSKGEDSQEQEYELTDDEKEDAKGLKALWQAFMAGIKGKKFPEGKESKVKGKAKGQVYQKPKKDVDFSDTKLLVEQLTDALEDKEFDLHKPGDAEKIKSELVKKPVGVINAFLESVRPTEENVTRYIQEDMPGRYTGEGNPEDNPIIRQRVKQSFENKFNQTKNIFGG